MIASNVPLSSHTAVQVRLAESGAALIGPTLSITRMGENLVKIIISKGMNDTTDAPSCDKTGAMFVIAVEFYRLCCFAAEIFSHT